MMLALLSAMCLLLLSSSLQGCDGSSAPATTQDTVKAKEADKEADKEAGKEAGKEEGKEAAVADSADAGTGSKGDTSPMKAAGKASGQMRKYAVLSKAPPKEQKKASFAELGLRDESEPSPSGMMSRREPKRGGLARATGGDKGEAVTTITADANGGTRLVPAVKTGAQRHEPEIPEVAMETSFLGLSAQEDAPAEKRRHAYHTVGSGAAGLRKLAPDEGGLKHARQP